MRIERWDPADETITSACRELHVAAHRADEADDPPFSAGTFALYLRQGFDKTPGEVWFAADDESRVVGYYRMQLYDLENPPAARAAGRWCPRPRGGAVTAAPCCATRRRGRRRTGGRC